MLINYEIGGRNGRRLFFSMPDTNSPGATLSERKVDGAVEFARRILPRQAPHAKALSPTGE
jgi:hypothetical protein